jgi:16S rRNA (guanine966-N2)-methyltransferase
MRIIAGKFKNRRLLTQKEKEEGFRPTTSKVREAAINILISMFGGPDLEGLTVADICCGSGAFGFECLSREAKSVVFVDNSLKRIQLLEKNLETLQVGYEQFRLIRADISTLPKMQPVDIAYIDPPYHRGMAGIALKKLLEQGWIKPQGILIVEQAKRDALPEIEELQILSERLYGNTKLTFLRLE